MLDRFPAYMKLYKLTHMNAPHLQDVGGYIHRVAGEHVALGVRELGPLPQLGEHRGLEVVEHGLCGWTEMCGGCVYVWARG